MIAGTILVLKHTNIEISFSKNFTIILYINSIIKAKKGGCYASYNKKGL